MNQSVKSIRDYQEFSDSLHTIPIIPLPAQRMKARRATAYSFEALTMTSAGLKHGGMSNEQIAEGVDQPLRFAQLARAAGLLNFYWLYINRRSLRLSRLNQ